MIISPKILNNICLNSHPLGCLADVKRQINYIQEKGTIHHGPQNVVVIGASTGYGLASRIAAGFGSGAKTLGVGFEKSGSDKGPGSAGFYNQIAFDHYAQKEGLLSLSLNADAFANETKHQVIEQIRKNFGKIDLLVYSLASPVRTHEGITYRSVLKPIGQEYIAKSLDPFKGEIKQVTVMPATEKEQADTIKVMGGEDWELWIRALVEANLMADKGITVAYSYIGPEITYPFYRSGTIGKAKEHLESTVHQLDRLLSEACGGKAFISVNKALVTRASAVIPAVSLYIALLYKIMKAKKIHEGCIEQMDRLFRSCLYTNQAAITDPNGLIRIDDWEMRQDVQAEVMALWDKINAENMRELTDITGFEEDFLRLNGFAIPGVDYSADISERQLLGQF